MDPVAHKTDAHNAVCTRMENLAFRQIPLKIHRGELTNALARARQKEEKKNLEQRRGHLPGDYLALGGQKLFYNSEQACELKLLRQCGDGSERRGKVMGDF